jgi:short subunit dehydrogenase-like uncharacterized protein
VPADRSHDLILFGATGFTGALTAEYLARHAPPGTRWALAGRNRAKLETLRNRLTAEHPACASLPLLHADVHERESLIEVAAAGRVVVTTVGPYLSYGEPLVSACAEAGTDYVDLAGEAEFVDEMYLRHHHRAQETGARIVHSCGFDSIPADLGAYFTVRRLPSGVPIRIEGFVRASGAFSGGTLHSAVTGMSRMHALRRASSRRREVEPLPVGRRARAITPRPRFERAVGAWVLPLPAIDPQVVRRSAVALDVYGPDFSYSHHVAVRRLPVALGLVGGAAALFALCQIAPARAWLLGRRRPGEGPTPDRRRKSWFAVCFIAEGDGRRVACEVAGGDPGYGETSKMLAEAALCLAFDDLPESAGQVTTAAAMGDALIERLTKAGITFTVLDTPPSYPPSRRRE